MLMQKVIKKQTLKNKTSDNYSKPKNICVFVAWPYANADSLHIGHLVGAILPADIFARFQRKLGNNVVHVTGTDMHGTPVSVKAEKAGKTAEEFALYNHSQFVEQLKALHINFNLYVNTHTRLHAEIVNNMGKYLYQKGFLIPKKTKIFYDTQANKYLPDRYVEGTCPYCGYSPARGDQCDNCGRILDPQELINPVSKLTNTTPVLRTVTNLYLDLPKFQEELKNLAESNPRLRPHVKEMTLGFLKEGLKQRPVTRNMDWGIPVDIPGYEDQVWYVWFEAVIGYLSAVITFFDINNNAKNNETQLYENIPIIYSNVIGRVDTLKSDTSKRSGESNITWESFWKGPNAYHYYFLGKDNIPFHTIIWPAQILMYNYKYQNNTDFNQYILPGETKQQTLNLYYDVPANQFLNMNNAKISKSTGNYISIKDLIKKYEITSIRYVFSRLMPESKDANFTLEKFTELVNNELVATIGNLIYRTLSFAKKNYPRIEPRPVSPKIKKQIEEYYKETRHLLETVQLGKALEKILEFAALGNKIFNDAKPWEKPQANDNKQAVFDTITIVLNLINMLSPFLPCFTQQVASFIDSHTLALLKTNPDLAPFNPIYIDTSLSIKKLKVPVQKIH